MGNLFDQMATQNQNGTPVAQAPSQAPTPQPVVSPATDQQKPQTFDASAVAPGATFHGTADEAQNLFTQMAQQEQARKNQGQPAPHVTNKPTPPRIGGAGGSWFDDQSKTGSDTFNWINKATEKAYATVGKAIPDWATTPLAAETKYVAKPIDAVGDWITERGKEAGEAPADFITGMKNKDYDQVAKAIAHYVAPEAAKWTKMSPEQQKRAAESHPWMYGIGGGVGEFSGSMLSPVNLAIMVAMPEEKAFPLLSKVLKAGFASQMSAQAMAQVADLAHNWGDMSQADKIRALTELPLNVGTLVWGSLMGKKGEGKFNPETGDKKTLLRPTTKTIAGVPRDITASQQEGAGKLTNFFTHEAELPGMKSPSDLQQDTRPQGTKQAVSVLSQRATDKINAHDAIVNGGKAPAEITGTQTPGKHVSPDQIWQAMQESANQTYDKARSVSEKEQSDWKTTRDQAEQDHRASIERQNADIDAHNADPDNEPKIDRIEYNENDLNLPERPKTYDELKKDIDNARDRLSKLNDTDDREKARTVDLPKAEKAMDDWFKNHEDAISPNEYQSAKDLWSDSMKFRTIADKLRRKIDTGTLTGNAIRALKSDINGEAIKRRGAAGDGTFQRLMGQEATENLEQVAKLFDPLEPTDPRKAGFKSWGLLAAHHLVSTLLIPFFGHFVAAGEAARLGMDMLLNHVMFDPEFGKSFSTFAEAVKNSAATGAEVPAAALQGVKERLEGIANRYRRSKFSGEEGAVGAAVKKRTVGPDAGARPLNPGADMRTAGANYAEDLKAQQQAKEERDNGTLPEGVSFLQRAQQLKEQFVKAKEEPTSNHVTRAADAYNKAVGRPVVDTAKTELDTNRARVADDFDEMQHQPEHPEVKQSYSRLVDELKAQKKHLEQKGYTFSLSSVDPYKNYEEMRDDVLNNKHLTVWTGGNPLQEGHPLAEPVKGMKGWDGNTLLRAVHDVMGHVAGDNDFSEKGEENAYNLHKQTFSKEALPALTTETKGQTSWFFNNKGVRGGAPLGAFAEQKAGLLPEFLRDSPKSVLNHIKSDKPFAILTAENPQNTRLSDAENVTANKRMIAELKAAGYSPVEVEGHNQDVAGQKEHSFFVPDMDAKTAARFGRKYGQTAILTQEGLHDLNKNVVNPSENGKVLVGEEAAKQPYYSSVGGVPFSVPLDFSKENAPTTASKDNSDSEISTRYPTATGADASRNPSKASDWAAIQEADRLSPTRQSALGKTVLGYKEKLARTVAEYTGMFPDDATRLEALKNPDKVLSKFVNHVSDNLEWIYNQIPDEIKSQTRQWYDAASRMLDERAQKYGYSHEQAAGVTAALSPQNPWDNNLGLADRMMDAYRNQQNHPYTEEMESKAAELRKVPTQSGAFKKMLRDINGKKLSEIRNANKDVEAAQKALWIRLYDEAHGPESNPEYSPTGEVVGHGSSRSWVGLDHMMKAIKILENGDVSNINDVMGQGHKIRNFYNNLINPNSKNGHVTIDTHAVSAGLLSPLGAKDTEPMHNFGNSTRGIPGAPRHAATGLKGSYPLYAEAYQKTAQKLGIQPRELQSIVWEGIKSLMGDDKKTSDLKSRVKEIWQDVASGKLEPQEAREKIKEASYGFAKPAWMADEAWEKLGNEGEDTGFDTKAMAATQHQMISVGGETHGITADINPPSANPELKGAPRPSSTDYERFADWANANAHPEHVLTITAHELAHAFVQHSMEIPTSGMKIGLGHRAVYEGKPLGEGLGPAPMTGVSGGFVSPGGDWARAAEQASHEGKQPEFLQKYTTQLMAGRAMEEMLGVDPTAAKVHTSSDVSMARQALEQSGVPREKIGLLLEDATEKAKQILQSNWGTLQHMTRQAVNHFGGDLLDSGHFHKYRNGGVYGQP